MLEAKIGTKRYSVQEAKIASEVGKVTSAHLRLAGVRGMTWQDAEEIARGEVEIIGFDPQAFTEKFLVLKAGLCGDLLELEAVGQSAMLETTGAVRAWSGRTPAEIAAEVILSAGLTAKVDLGETAYQPLEFALQPGGTDWEFLCEILSQCGGTVTERDGEIHVTSAPGGTEHDVIPQDVVLRPTWFGYAARRPRSLRQHLEQDGAFQVIEADGGSSEAWFAPAAGVASVSDAEAGLLGLRRAAEGGVEVKLALARPDIAPGDLVDMPGAPGPLAVVRREIRFDGSGPLSCKLHLVDPERFAIWGAQQLPRPASHLLQGIVRSSHIDRRPGWCSVSLVDDADTTEFAAQLTCLGGAGAGVVIPPAVGATVTLGFLGAGLSPRPVVLAVMRDASNDAHGASARDPQTALIAALPGGGSIALSRDGEADAIDLTLGSGKTQMRVDANGTIEVTGETVSLTASALSFKAKNDLKIEAGSVTVSARTVEISGTTIDLKKGG